MTSLAVSLAWRQRHDARHPAEIGLAWFAAFLAPVLPLEHHAYLYYLYVPWAGAAIAVAALGERALARLPARAAEPVAFVALTLFAAVEIGDVRAREQMAWHGLPVDRTIRDSVLLRNAVAGLRAANLLRPRWVINPLPIAHLDL